MNAQIRAHFNRPYRLRVNHLVKIPLAFAGEFLGDFTPGLTLRISSFIRSISLSTVKSMKSLAFIEVEADVEDARVLEGIGFLTVHVGTASPMISPPSANLASFLVLDDDD